MCTRLPSPAAWTDATERTQALFQAALRSHRWWLTARDPEGLGLVAILHPWESGSDNSPAWDEALARVPTTTTTTIRRKDTGHVDAAMRPRDEDYQRFIHLVDTYRDCGWDPKRQWAAAPFKIADVQMTAILARSTADLMHLAESLGTEDEERELARMHDRLLRGSRAPLAAGTLPLRLPRPDFRPGHRGADAGRLHPARRR